jgi:AcrR family transcriptional regulator
MPGAPARGASAAAGQTKVRRPQAERSADTVGKVIEATIKSLHALGYSQTTVKTVAEMAGVSRGALTHQFPSKVDLMLAVVKSVYEADALYYATVLGPLPPREAIARFPEAMWEVFSRPSAIAVTEIMLASRSDPILQKQLGSMQAEIDAQAGWLMVHWFKAGGLEDRKDGAAVHRLLVAAVRGLAIEAVSSGQPAPSKDAVKVLTEVVGLLYPQLKSS